MPYPKIKFVHVLLLISLSIFITPIAVTCLAEEKVSADTVSENNKSRQDEETADAPEERKLPALEPGAWQPLFELEKNIYPSVAISTATLKKGLWDDKRHLGDPWGTIGIALRGTENDCPITVTISGGNFIKPSTFTGTLPEEGAVYCVYPDLNYDYEKLLTVKQTIPETISFRVTIGQKQEPEKTVRVQVRPVNECVYNFVDSSGNAYDVSYFFAAYVNENHPIINEILKKAIALKLVDDFEGYSGDRESVKAQLEAIWETLKRMGMHYSAMPAIAEDDSPYIASQYVRLLGESVNYSHANCVDGSVLMASIFRKIGLNASLVELPEHMIVAVSLDEEGKEQLFIETTVLGSESLDEAAEDGYKLYEESKNKFDSQIEEDQAYNIVNIQDARVLGIMPIKDSSAN